MSDTLATGACYEAVVDVEYFNGKELESCRLYVTTETSTREIIAQLDAKYGPGWLQFASGRHILMSTPSLYCRADKFIYRLARPGGNDVAEIAIVSHDGTEQTTHTVLPMSMSTVLQVYEFLEPKYGRGVLQDRHAAYYFRDLAHIYSLKPGLYTYRLLPKTPQGVLQRCNQFMQILERLWPGHCQEDRRTADPKTD